MAYEPSLSLLPALSSTFVVARLFHVNGMSRSYISRPPEYFVHISHIYIFITREYKERHVAAEYPPVSLI